jgi:hypothetical protein
MRDSRVTLLTPTEISTNTTIYSEAVNLLDGYVGSHLEPTGEYGVGVKVMYTSIATTGSFEVATFVEESDNNSTWYRIATWDTIDPIDKVEKLKIVMEKRVRPDRKYLRVGITTTNISGSEKLTAQADIVDGATCGNTTRYA